MDSVSKMDWKRIFAILLMVIVVLFILGWLIQRNAKKKESQRVASMFRSMYNNAPVESTDLPAKIKYNDVVSAMNQVLNERNTVTY